MKKFFSDYAKYTKISSKYDQMRKSQQIPIILGAMALKGPLHKQSLLDVGCGTGNLLTQILPHIKQGSGIQYNQGMIQKAKQKLPNTRIQHGEACSLSFFLNQEFDAVSLSHVIHHFPRSQQNSYLRKTLKQVKRVLKPGGLVHIVHMLHNQIRYGQWYTPFLPQASSNLMSRYVQQKVLEEILEEEGFQLQRWSPIVPLKISVIDRDLYLKEGMKSIFKEEYRAGDSLFSLAEEGELEKAFEEVRKIIDSGKEEEFLAQKERLRMNYGQVAYFLGNKSN